MGNIFLSFIKPFLSAIDRGSFFRRPFGWLYAIIAIISLITPFFLIYLAYQLHTAFQWREKWRIEVELNEPLYEKAKTEVNAVQEAKQQYAVKEQNYYSAFQNFNVYLQNSQYYNQYFKQQFQAIKQEFEKTRKEFNILQIAKKKEEVNWQKTMQKFEKVSQEFNRVSQEYQYAQMRYENAKFIPGAFHTPRIGDKAVIAFIFYSIVVLFAGWLNFQLWWNRKIKLTSISRDEHEFTVIPVIAQNFQTLGESLGTMIAIMGFFTTLISNVFDVCFGGFGIPYLNSGIASGIFGAFIQIFIGYFIIMIVKIIAELIKAAVHVANFTSQYETKTNP